MLAIRYTQAQREAIASIYPRATAAQVSRLAAVGALMHSTSGVQLAPFEVPANSVRSIANRARRKREAAEADAELVELPAPTARELCRRRLLLAIDAGFTRLEIKRAQGRDLDSKDLTLLVQLARACRELAAISGPNEPPTPAPGAKVNGVRNGGETRGGIAGPILAAYRAER